MQRASIFIALVILFGVAMWVTSGATQAAPLSQAEPTAPSTPPVAHFPIWDEWASSSHANIDAPAFAFWNEETPPRIPAECAKCHSGAGFQDALGADGSAPGIDGSHALGSMIDCDSCHNDATIRKDAVIMPSGLELLGVGASTVCMECHQGMAAKSTLDAAIVAAAVNEDAISPALAFTAYHTDAGIALHYGTLAKGGYEYNGQSYDVMATHVTGYQECVDCHDPHTTAVDLAACATCHPGVVTTADLRSIRMDGARRDFNGNGSVTEGIYYELAGLQAQLLASIQSYAREIASAEIVYAAETPPYFFADANQNGQADAAEITPDNHFAAWTPRLLKAAYNYRAVQADDGAYIHASQYAIQLLYDAIADLNTVLVTPVDLTALERIGPGHFSGAKRSFRYWDARGVVPGSCARCHTETGLPVYLKETVNTLTPPSNRLRCTTCHSDLGTYALRATGPVRFPSGAVIDSGDPGVNLCLNCHQGRESTISLNRMIGDATPDEQVKGLRFPDVHFFAASATRWGAEAQGAYEYSNKEYGDKEYVGFFTHGFGQLNLCKDCHDPHTLEIKTTLCVGCHPNSTTSEGLRGIRMNQIDYDGDGDSAEGIYHEVETLQALLLAELQRYAIDVTDRAIAYAPNRYPVVFVADRNANGLADPEEIKMDNLFGAWTPRLLRAAYNYQNSLADPGAFAHNGRYIVQTLYDSIEDLGGDVSGLIRP
jgi:hypothetical protein